MKFRQISLAVVFYSSILTNVSIQATHYDYQSPVPNLTSRGDDQAARTLRELTYAKKFLSELPATINGILWPQRSVSRGQTFARDSESTVVEVTSAITTNTIWQEEHIYHVTADIPVQALLVIEPGTIITFAEGAHLRVNNGGCLVACGTPDKIIRFVPDETIEQYIGAFNAVYIEETASVSTKISYCLIEQAYIGILTSNIRLDTPIRHNYFNFCVYGVTEQGIQLTDIFNNQFYVSYEGALYIDVWSLEEEECSESEIRIQNNTSHYSQYNALTILGATDPVNAGRIEIVNNIFANAYYGIYWEYSAWLYSAHNGYYNNMYNRNYTHDEPGCVEMSANSESPFETGTGPFDQVYLKPNSPFINAGCARIEIDPDVPGSYMLDVGDVSQLPHILGFTTTLTDDCDLGLIDIGFHNPNFDAVNVGEYAAYLIADLNQDGTVDNADLTILKSHYGQSGSSADGDINGDGIVDAHDLRIMRKLWGQNGYAHPNIAIALPVDLINITGNVNISVTGYDTNTQQVFIFLDGQYIGEIEDFNTEDYNHILLDTFAYMNGIHELKAIGINLYGFLTLSETMEVTFNNSLQCMIAKENFENGKDYDVDGIYTGTENFIIKLIDINDNIIWSQSIGNSINATIPTSELATDLIFNVIISKETVSEKVVSSDDDDDVFEKFISQKFDPKEWEKNPVYYRVLITLPEKGLTKEYKKCVMAVRNACNAQGLLPRTLVLYNKTCTWDNLSFALKNITSLRYWYHGGGHGTAKSGPIGQPNYRDRTGIKISYPGWISKSEWVYSLVKTSDPDELKKRKSIGSLGLNEWGGLKIVFFDVCYTSEDACCTVDGSKHDMAWALGAYSTYNEQWHTQIYLGWHGARSSYEPTFKFNTFVEVFWNTLASGTKTVQEALNAARIATGEFYLEKIQPHGYGAINQIKFEADPPN